MRKLMYGLLVSLDGYVEGLARNIDWIKMDEELHQFFNDQQAEVDTYLYGRGMYETMSAF